MNAVLAFRDLIPVILLTFTLIDLRNNGTRGSSLNYLFYMLLFWTIFWFGVLFFSTEGWHPISAIVSLLTIVGKGCGAVAN